MRTLVLFLFALTTVAAAGCGPIVVVQQGPDPFAGKRSFAVQPIEYAGLRVGDKGEEEYLAGKKQDTVATWQGDKAGMAQTFAEGFAAIAGRHGLQPAPGPGPEVILVRPAVQWVEPGSFNGFVNFPSQATVQVTYTDALGAVLTQAQFKCAVRADIYHPSSGQRLRDCARNLGESAARIIRPR